MKPWFKFVLVLFVIIECSGIAYFGYKLYVRKKIRNNVLSAVTFVPIRNEYFTSSPSAELYYFYEPTSNKDEESQPSWLSHKVVNTINADTLNERYDYTLEKPNKTYRIIALGDSFTFGRFVNTVDSWPEQLEDMLNARCRTWDISKIEVINLGVYGYDVQYIAHRYGTRGVKYKPDLIIWFESGYGFTRLNEELIPIAKKFEQSLSKDEISVEKKNPGFYVAWEKASDEFFRRYSQEQISEKVYAAWLNFFTIRGTTKTIISTFSNISLQDKASLEAWTQGQPNVNLYFGIRDRYTNDGVLPDGHPSREGHQTIAEDLFAYLKNNGIVTCGK